MAEWDILTMTHRLPRVERGQEGRNETAAEPSPDMAIRFFVDRERTARSSCAAVGSRGGNPNSCDGHAAL